MIRNRYCKGSGDSNRRRPSASFISWFVFAVRPAQLQCYQCEWRHAARIDGLAPWCELGTGFNLNHLHRSFAGLEVGGSGASFCWAVWEAE